MREKMTAKETQERTLSKSTTVKQIEAVIHYSLLIPVIYVVTLPASGFRNA